jgi:putative membrane protein
MRWYARDGYKLTADSVHRAVGVAGKKASHDRSAATRALRCIRLSRVVGSPKRLICLTSALDLRVVSIWFVLCRGDLSVARDSNKGTWPMRMRQLSLLLLLGLGIGSSGCSKDASTASQPGASQGNEEPPTPATGTVPMNKLTDGQIAKVVATVDGAEIEQAQIALKKTSDASIREFATHMVDEHTASKQAGAQLASRDSLELSDSPKSVALQASGAQMLEKLNGAEGATFDALYVDGQIDQHAEVLQMIDDQLLPGVVNADLRASLTNARAMVQHHLDQARQLKK